MKMKTVIIRLTPDQAEELAELASLTDRSKVGAVRYAVHFVLTSLRVYSALNEKNRSPLIADVEVRNGEEIANLKARIEALKNENSGLQKALLEWMNLWKQEVLELDLTRGDVNPLEMYSMMTRLFQKSNRALGGFFGGGETTECKIGRHERIAEDQV